MMENTVSVIIPTYRRKKYLIDVLGCLKKQTILPKEVFIIDSSPVSDLLGQKEIEQFPLWVIYETCENIKNIPWKKNLVIPQCKGDIVLFLDDDILFGENLIEDHIECYGKTGADGISGLVLLPDEKKCSKPVTNNEGWLWYAGPNVRNLDKITETKVICTANFSIKREVLLLSGGFDEQIRGTWDDTELGYRLFQMGYKIIHHPKPRVLHLKPNIGGSRENGVDIDFALANVLYFHLKHSIIRPAVLIDLAAIWKYCRPGRRWIKVRYMLKRCASVRKAINIAKKRIDEGPKYL
jgi:GT2 family glycosyltransferase